MGVSRPFIAAFGLLLLAGACARGQQSDGGVQHATPKTTERDAPQTAEPGTAAEPLKPASKAPKTHQAPNPRLDSKPHTDLSPSLDSSRTTADLGLGAMPEMDLGPDVYPVTPPGMLARSKAGNPAMVYFALPHRSGDTITAGDAAILAARQDDLVRAAQYRGFDLHRQGWMYQQGVCPAMQPDAEQIVGVPAGGGGEGSILLHFVRRDAGGSSSAFTALVPRDRTLPVRTIPVAHRGVQNSFEFLSARTTGAVVNEGMPPATLFTNLEPLGGWIAASACIAEFGGAYPHVPNEPSLARAITTAPPPRLRLRLDGKRDVIFTDRIDDAHYVVWNEHVSNRGRLLGAEHESVSVPTRPVTNPPLPKSRVLTAIPEPKFKVLPEPPSPLSSGKQ